jgi:hypothetical protein
MMPNTRYNPSKVNEDNVSNVIRKLTEISGTKKGNI